MKSFSLLNGPVVSDGSFLEEYENSSVSKLDSILVASVPGSSVLLTVSLKPPTRIG